MGFIRAGFRSDTQLKEHTGELIALKFDRIVQNVPATIPADKTTGEPERKVVQDVVSARLYTFGPTGVTGKYKGTTFVYQTSIAAELEAAPLDWHIGVLTQTEQRNDTSRTVYTLEAPEGDAERTFQAAEKLLTESRLG